MIKYTVGNISFYLQDINKMYIVFGVQFDQELRFHKVYLSEYLGILHYLKIFYRLD